MSSPRGLSADCMVETAEGPVRMADTPGKGFAVMTRLEPTRLGFRQLIKVETAAVVPLVRVVLETGQEAVTARGHRFFRRGMEAVAASDLAPGDLLETAFHYPEGYWPPDAGSPTPRVQLAVRAVEAAGEGPVLFGIVRDTHTLFLTAGVLVAE
jgi:hypothetical protein